MQYHHFEYQQPVATVYDEAVGKQWYDGFVIAHSQSDDKLVVDHLERKGNNSIWQRPSQDDTQDVRLSQVIPCPVEGDWDFSLRAPQFIVHNSNTISEKFEEHWGST